MDALNVISVAQAKNWLIVEDSVDDADIERLIKTAVAWVETYTCYRFYQRTETAYSFQAPGFNPANYFPPTGSGEWGGTNGIRTTPLAVSVYAYPVTITSVKDQNNADAFYSTVFNPLKLLIYTGPNCLITLQTGYANPADAPAPLLEACYKLIIYLYNNRDMYSTNLPTDIQMLLNQYRRAII